MSYDFRPPTPDDSRRFLMSFHLNGSMEPGIKECVWRAYIDQSRTAHGVGKGSGASRLKHSAHRLLERLVKTATERTWDAKSFDKWHESQCVKICQHYSKGGYDSFAIGQAQKWLNMSIKYSLALNSSGMLRFEYPESLRMVAHIPLDNFMLTALNSYGAPRIASRWSRITIYKPYMDYQMWVRERFPDSIPLDVEFHLWAKESKLRRASLQNP